MNELTRTLSILAAALLLGIAAFLVGRDSPEVTADHEVGKMLVTIDDPLQVKGLKIVKFDGSTSKTDEFEVAQVDGVWRIPSHQNYPADAQQQLTNAATSVMDVKILDAVSDDKGSHEEFGVLDPTELDDPQGATGVGDRITLSGTGGEPIAEFIVGHQVQDQPGQRYVRRAGLDQVYVVKLDPSRLSTQFSDWIEKDLLQLDPFDIHKITFDNYTVQRGVNRLGQPAAIKLPESEITVAFDSIEDAWTLDSLKEAKNPDQSESEMKDVPLGENEQLNAGNLNALRSALDDLQIVDVERKPEGLKGSTLEEFLTKNREAFESLFSRGFSVRYNQLKKEIEIVSDEGDVRVGMHDGVQYVLRFGDVAGGEQREKQAEGDGDQPPTTTSKSDVLRYLWVTAEVNEDLILKPVLLQLPGEPAPEEESPTTEETPTEEDPREPAAETPVEPLPGEESTEPGEETTEKQPVEEPATEQEPQEETGESIPEEPPEGPQGAEGAESESGESGEPSSAEEPPVEEAAPVKEESTADETAPEESALEVPAEGETPADETDAATPEEPGEVATAPTREQIESENKRRQDEYDVQLKEAHKRVDELNEKFADWYFVISDDVYEKIHLNRDQIIEPKPAEEENPDAAQEPPAPGSLDEFNQLKQLP